MSKKQFLFGVILLAAAIAGIFVYRYLRIRKIALERDKITAELKVQEALLAASGMPGYWIKTVYDRDPRILEGEHTNTPTLITQRLNFSTTDTVQDEVDVYKRFFVAQQWVLESADTDKLGATVLSVSLGRQGTMTVRIAPKDGGSIVALKRIIAI